MNNTYKFRASYSVLNMWANGQIEDAIRGYFKLPRVETWPMKQGKAYHEEWNAETLQTGCLPAVFGGAKLANPMPEQKFVLQVYPWLEMVGIVDLIDSPDIHEYKTGRSRASHYINTYQVGMYGLLTLANNIQVNRAWVHHYDQYTKRVDTEGVWLSDAYLRETMNWVETMAGEMREYILKNNLHEQYGKS